MQQEKKLPGTVPPSDIQNKSILPQNRVEEPPADGQIPDPETIEERYNDQDGATASDYDDLREK